MHIVVMGCGRVGSRLAHCLEDRGHSVAIIDREATAFRRLGPEFGGRQVTGIGFDRKTLVEAGIEQAGAFAAVSSGDNSNIISARVARETFGVDHVVARIYDPKRAAVYARLGIPTIATVPWTTDQLLRALLTEGPEEDWRDPSGAIALVQVQLNESWVGKTVEELETASGARVAFITRFGEGTLPTPATVVQSGDLVHMLVTNEVLPSVAKVTSAAPEEVS